MLLQDSHRFDFSNIHAIVQHKHKEGAAVVEGGERKVSPSKKRSRKYVETSEEVQEKVHLIESIGRMAAAVSDEHFSTSTEFSSLKYMFFGELDPSHGSNSNFVKEAILRVHCASSFNPSRPIQYMQQAVFESNNLSPYALISSISGAQRQTFARYARNRRCIFGAC